MDYESLRTLVSVIRNQNFERAAKELFVSQSAVSQRINQLEAEYGQRLLIRELPYKATDLGEKLLSHYRKVLSLEQELAISSTLEEKPTIRLAMNVDSLEIWFKRVLQNHQIAQFMNLEITIDDEKYTLDYLKSGRVDVSIGIAKTPVSNHEFVKLGSMTYVLVGSQEFKKTFLPRNVGQIDFSKHPAIVFNERDDLHTQYLKKHFQFTGAYPKTSIPSVSGIKSALVSGFGYGLQPLMDISLELKSKKLVLLDRDNTFQRDLYLHHWNYQTPALKLLLEAIREAAGSLG